MELQWKKNLHHKYFQIQDLFQSTFDKTIRTCRHNLYNSEIWLTIFSSPLKESEVAQSCPTLCDPIDCSLPGSSIHGIFPGKSTGVGCHFPLQGIFPTQGSNPGLLHCRQMLYCLSHQWSLLKNIRNIFSHCEHIWLMIITWQHTWV